VSGPDALVHSGKFALRRKAKGAAQDFFTKGASFAIPPTGVISVWCHLDPDDQSKAIKLQFHVGGLNPRAVWVSKGQSPSKKCTPRDIQGRQFSRTRPMVGTAYPSTFA
jgi:hypothetical protein